MKQKLLARSIAACIALLSATISIAEEEAVELETFTAEEEVDDDLGILQTEPVDSVFGFGKTILETPRSVSTISSELLDQFNVTGINDIVNFVPGTFTTSFFGVAGSLDIRGSSAENYFRGVKRLNNEGNYPTPIGASDRVDVIRGPMSVISGPSKVGGAMNFVPKSARAETGQYLEEATGKLSYTAGSWDKSVLTAEVGGPSELFGKSAGFYIYGELEDSDSYYNNDFNKQTLLQASFNIDISDKTRIEMGGMYQNWKGHENGGWNRVTQDLIDNGTYITGQPATNIDSEFGNGDGLIDEAEIDAWEASLAGVVSTGTPFADEGEITCFTGISAFCFTGDFGLLDASQIPQTLVDQLGIGLDPATVGTATLDGSQVLIDPLDQYDTRVTTFYFDVIHQLDSGWKITNKVFFDAQDYINVDSYGFTKIADAWVIEDQLIFENQFEFEGGAFGVSLSPSYRYTDAFYALDFTDEIFDRPDLTVGFNALSRQSVPSRFADGEQNWSNYTNSQYGQLGFAVLTDTTVFENLNIVAGARYDYVDIDSEEGDGDGPVTRLAPGFNTEEFKASDTDSGLSWNFNLSYNFPFGISPYYAKAETTTIISGSAADVVAENVRSGTFLGESELDEIGIKGSFLDGRLFAAVAVYEQSRIAFDSQAPVNNQPTNSEGVEFELRWLPTDKLSIIANYAETDITVTTGGSTFSFIGAADLTQIDPATVYGAIIGGNHAVDNETARGGIPGSTGSLILSYSLTDELQTSFSTTVVDETESSVLGGIVLPAYTVFNASAVYDNEVFEMGLYLNNLSDERYFRGNFPSLYGNNAVLPEVPFNWSAKFAYNF